MLFYDIILKDIVNYRAVSKPITIWVFSPQTHGFPPKCLWYCWWTQVFHMVSTKNPVFFTSYPLVNKQWDPENHQVLEETNLPIPICQGLC